MSLSPERQFSELFLRSNEILVLLPKNPSIDLLSSAFGIAHFAEKNGKRATVVGENIKEKSSILSFLPHPTAIFDHLAGAREFVLSFNTKFNPIIGTRSAQEEDEFRVYITPEKGIIDPRDFSFIPAKFKFDLALVLGAPDRESLGKTYEDNPDIFYELPIVNIDYHSENERFGQLNFVDLVASSVSEIVAKLLFETAGDSINDTTANALYTGIVAATESFQKENSTPKALELSAKLLSLGANREQVIQSLYRNESLSLLKLWGRAMASLRAHEEISLAAATLTSEDLVLSRATPDNIPAILERIRRHISSNTFFLILLPGLSGETFAYIQAASPERLFPFLQKFPPTETIGDTYVFLFPDSTPEKTEELIASILGEKK